MTTTTPPPIYFDCDPETKSCFREEQRSRRIRSAPQDYPYFKYITTTTTTTTTTTLTTVPPQYLFDLISIPDSGDYIVCPALEEFKPPMYFDAFGGDEKFSSGNMIFHKFYNDGVFFIEPYDDQVFEYANIEFLLVGGGGGGGNYDGGGGGGGGGVKKSSFNFPAGSYEIKIGIGGSYGSNGEDTSIPKLGIKAIGGGAGGNAFSNNAQAGGNGGGAGGRSTSVGGQGIGGNNGGSSLGNFGGGGGGGAGSDGQSVPITIDGKTLDAGNGGDGIAITFDQKNYTYYAGGGAGDAFTGLLLPRSLGGGGSTLNKDGIDGLGGGGAGSGGSGGKGFCMIGYIPVTTPPPTTTTTLPPIPPDPVQNLSATGEFQQIRLTWNDPLYTGSSSISSYTFNVYNNLGILIDTLVVSPSLIESVQTGDQQFPTKIFVVSGLEDQLSYTIEVVVSNSEGNSSGVSVSALTVTTTTSTTTVPPDFVSFTVDFDGDVEAGYIGSESITINGPEFSRRIVSVQVLASGGYVFYQKPDIAIFGNGSQYIDIDNITSSPSSDRSYVTIDIPTYMPDQPATTALAYISAVAETPTTTTTTSTTTTLPPFCTSLYDFASFTENEDGSYSPPSDEDLLLKPLQFFLSKAPIPYQIAGSVEVNSEIAGSPWYGGTYFEIGRKYEEYQSYKDGLPEDHNKLLLVSENDFGQNLFSVEKYLLEYPEVNRSTNSINFSINQRLLSYQISNILNYDLRISLGIDYICDMSNNDPYGRGEENLSGFLSLSINEYSGSSKYTLFDKIYQNDYNIRQTGTFFSQIDGSTYYFMLDFGTRDKIVGI